MQITNTITLKNSLFFNKNNINHVSLVYNAILKVKEKTKETWDEDLILYRVLKGDYGCIISNNNFDVAIFYVQDNNLFIHIAYAIKGNNPLQLYYDDFITIKNELKLNDIEFESPRKGYLKIKNKDNTNKFKIKTITYKFNT